MHLEAVRLPAQISEAMLAHATWCYPLEACGLLASDDDGRWRMFYPTTNVDNSAVSYTVDPDEHFFALRHAEAQGWELTGVMHSHPQGAAHPSPADVSQALDPTWIYVVVGPVSGETEVRAFRIGGGAAVQLAIE